MQPRFISVMNGQSVKHTRLQGKVASEFSTYLVFPPYMVFLFGQRMSVNDVGSLRDTVYWRHRDDHTVHLNFC